MPFPRCLLLLCLVALSGCTPDPGDALFERYLSALAAADAAPESTEATLDAALPPRYPRPRRREVEVPTVRGGVLELFSLSRCDVSQLIAQRNSILGRHADSASHVALGGAILHRLKECQGTLDPDDDLQGRIEALISAKRPAQQALRWNASFGSKPFAQWWSLSARPLAPEVAEGTPAEPLDAMREALDAAQSGAVDKAQQQFSTAYQGLEGSESGGAWMRSAQRAITALQRASARLKGVAADGCKGARGEALQQSYQSLYRTQLVGHLHVLERQMQAMASALEALWAALDGGQGPPPEAVAAFRKRVWHGPESMARRLQRARTQHETAWQDVLRACSAPSD